jgi:hypothetical protein
MHNIRLKLKGSIQINFGTMAWCKSIPQPRVGASWYHDLEGVNSKGLIWSRLLYFGDFMWMHSTTSMLELHVTSYRYGDIYNVIVERINDNHFLNNGLMHKHSLAYYWIFLASWFWKGWSVACCSFGSLLQMHCTTSIGASCSFIHV